MSRQPGIIALECSNVAVTFTPPKLHACAGTHIKPYMLKIACVKWYFKPFLPGIIAGTGVWLFFVEELQALNVVRA
jgi:hypothetical protein